MEEFSNVGTSITLTNCAIHSQSGRMGAVLCDTRGVEGHERIMLSMVSSNVVNQQIVGQDGIGVGELADRSRFLSLSGITTSLIGISFRNVSSLPGSVATASPSFRQQMIGSSVCLSNNHLSGSTVRDMNSGGSVLCSNTTFSWCRTTSEERPSSSPLHPSSLSSNDDVFTGLTFDGNDGNDTYTHRNVAITTKFDNCTFQNIVYETSEHQDGGSALILTADSTHLTLQDCKFINCSVSAANSSCNVRGGCVLLMGSYPTHLQSSLSVSSCSFDDWYPGHTTNDHQFGGGIGITYTSSSHSIIDSNFTLSKGKKSQENGGFIAIRTLESTHSLVTISNCRLLGDAISRGYALHIHDSDFGTGGFSVSDTEIVNETRTFSIYSVTGVRPVVLTRSTFVLGSLLVEHNVLPLKDPLLVVDCTFDQFPIKSTNDSPDLYFVGTVFRSSRISYSMKLIRTQGPCFVIFQSCLFDGCDFDRDELIYCSVKTSLTLDTCTMKDCKLSRSGSTLFRLIDSSFNAFSSSFSTVFANYSYFLVVRENGSVLLEDCRFDLEPSKKADFAIYQTSPSLLNASSVINCTSTRTITVTPDGTTITECPLFSLTQTPNAKTEINLNADSDPDGNPVETNDRLWPEIKSLLPGNSTILSLSDGPFTESSLLSIQTDVEIVGNGTESVHLTLDELPRPHTTQLTAQLEVEAGANLTLRSMTLVPSTSSSPLVTMNEEGNLFVKNVVVNAEQDRTQELLSFSAGTTRLSHSRFSSIAGSSALIVVSGTGSLTLSDTLFLSISRSHTDSVDGSVQSGSCVEGQTSGSISIRFCKFGRCSSNGRAGAIDIVQNDTTSRVEMEGCQFDENSAGTGLNEAERGDDVVLKDFSNEQLTLDFTAIESLSKLPFLIDDSHPHVPPPHTLHFSPKGFDMPLAWSAPNLLPYSRLSDLTLQFLLGSRLHNNVHTAVIATSLFNETMTPFFLKNASVSVLLHIQCVISVTQPNNESFCCLLNTSLSLKSLSLSFSELANTAFSVDQDSSISLTDVNITFTNKTLPHPFIDSTGRTTLISIVTISSGLSLNSVSFVRHIRSANDGNFTWIRTPVSSVSLTNQSFLHLEGMSTLDITSTVSVQNLTSSCDGSFLFAKKSNVTLSNLKVSSCSAVNGGFAFCPLCNVTILESEFTSCSARHGGVVFVELDGVNQLSSQYDSRSHSLFKDCEATATDANGVAVGRGGAICVKGTTTAKNPVYMISFAFENNTAAFGNDVFVEKTVLGGEGPDCLKRCGGESRSGWPHLEVEGITKEGNESEWTRISTFIDFPEINIDSRSGTDDLKCRFSIYPCETLEYAFRHLKLFYPDGTIYPRSALLDDNLTMTSISFENENMTLRGGRYLKLRSSGPAGSTMFVIKGDSRLTMQSLRFEHKANHTLLSVPSSEGWLEMRDCDVTIQSGTYSQPLISSVGCGLSLETFQFNYWTSRHVTFTVPLITYRPTPSQVGELGSAPFSITNSSFTNLTLVDSSIIVAETSGDITFQKINFTTIQNVSEKGVFLHLKGYNFKQQINPESWDSSFKREQHAAHLGEDTSLAETHKWRTGSIVYWLFSPSNVIVVNASDSNAVDHPNCGSSEFECSTLDAALESSSLNSLEVITVSSPSSLERMMTVNGTRAVRSSSTTQQNVTIALDSGITVKEGDLTLLSIQFSSANSSAFSNGGNTRSASLFVVDSGSLSLNSCWLSSFTLDSCPLISHTGGSLSLTGCELSSIERVWGKGLILSTTMTSGMGLTMDGVKLSSLACSSESPAVLLNLSWPTPPSPLPSFSLTNLKFERTEGQESSSHFVCIVGRNMSRMISEEDARFSGSYWSESNENDLWSVDEEWNLSVSLLFYLVRQEGPVRVRRGGSDVERCGYLNVWCKSVERAIWRTTNRTVCEIEILGDSDLSSGVTATGNVSVRKGEEGAILHVSSVGSVTTAAHHSLMMEELSIMLSPTHTADAVIIVPVSGSATLNEIVVKSSSLGGSDGTLVRVQGGRADIEDLWMECELKENSHFVEIVCGRLSVSRVGVKNGVGVESSLVWMEGGNVSVSGLWIVGVSSISGHLVSASGTSAVVKDIALSQISFLSAPFVFSSLESCSISNISIADFSSGVLIEGKDVASFNLETTRYSGPTKASLSFSNNIANLCSWSDSSIILHNCSSSFHTVEMKHLPMGAVSLDGGELFLTGCIFLDNSPSAPDFPSLHRNVFCSDGKVSIEAVGGGDGHSSPHHWISTHNCSVEKEDKILPAPFFVPSLSSNTSTSKFNTTEQKFDIVLKGETFVPCGLSLEVFERIAHSKTEFSEGEHVLVELDPSEVTTWKEDTIELSLHQSTISSLNRKHDLHCRVLFGESGKTDSFSLTGVKGKMSQAGRIVSIVVPIVCSVVLLLILLVVVLVLVCRRHQKKTIQEQSKQLNELDECQVEVKEDDIDNHSTIKPFFTASVETLHPHSLNMISNGVAQDQPEISSTRPQCIEYVDVLKCEGEPAVVRVDAKKTLYSALHFEKTLTLPKMEIRRQLVAGLDRLVQHNPFSDVLTQLSSHWILVDSSGSVCLKLDQHTNEMGLTTVEIANRKKMREEDRRWSAPEQIDEEMDHKNKDEKEKASQAVPFDPLKASVFRLGLVLWELETGVVPFGELDAVNASRQVKGGQVPLIENWEDTSLASIVGECLSFDPNERPSLSDLKKHFSSSSTPLDPPNVQQQPIASVAVTG
ncbi:hypothetical protein BLNAU_22524 [Blattamonas nauphoetae]|uniref:Protein kinase domain-containing protein n=1 Tax=Blattamonas nauphoetae TaxID=2049346 RepID=A0ABQ9WUX6_9EUKA|nr:hypothetical protein BLNAU_22524 [Blattamonas nauphoetae]